MKKNLFICLLMGVMAMLSISCDDDVSAADVPAPVTSTFQQMFPGATAKWEKEPNGQLKAEFYADYHEMEAWFQKDGTWVMTQKDLNVSELPQTVLNYLAQNHPGVEIDDADWVETPTEKYYRVELDRESKKDIVLTFTEQGELIK